MTCKNRILVAISGGIDSSVTAAILLNKGYEIKTVNILTGDSIVNPNINIIDNELNIKTYIANLVSEFDQIVIKQHIKQLKQGVTPSMCAYCNPNFKWKYITQFADKFNCEYIATGHYVQKVELNGKYYIKKGVDIKKDQSYFLWGLSQQNIKRTIFPLGEMIKYNTRELLTKYNLELIERTKESMSLCYIPQKQTYKQFVSKKINLIRGDVVDIEQNVIGTHDGVAIYTIGQKKGFDVDEKKYYIAQIDTQNNRLIATDNTNNLYDDNLYVHKLNIVDKDEFFNSRVMSVKIRGIGINPDGYCTVENIGDRVVVEKIKVKLEDPAWAIAKGQSAVFYIEGRVVAGGIIL